MDQTTYDTDKAAFQVRGEEGDAAQRKTIGVEQLPGVSAVLYAWLRRGAAHECLLHGQRKLQICSSKPPLSAPGRASQAALSAKADASALASYVTSDGLTSILTNYVTKSYLTDVLKGYQKKIFKK